SASRLPSAVPVSVPRFPLRPLLPSFPTRRSSDLLVSPRRSPGASGGGHARAVETDRPVPASGVRHSGCPPAPHLRGADGHPQVRSEEHTSELQSRFDLVCRLLLEKKKHTGSRLQS